MVPGPQIVGPRDFGREKLIQGMSWMIGSDIGKAFRPIYRIAH